MSFKELSLKAAYDSDEDDVLNDFYIVVLSRSKEYYRLAGFFSSTVLAVAAEGIASFISNKGKMKLIVSPILNASDIESIKKGLDTKNVVIKSFEKEIDLIKKEILNDHLKALSWMIANNHLDIKVAIPLKNYDIPMDFDEIKKSGLFHQKVGILEDFEGEQISFSGSINESANGWINNVEEFKVFRKWIKGEKKHFESDFNKINRYFGNKAKNTLIYDIPEAIKNKLIQIAPTNWDEQLLKKYYPIKRKKSDKVLNLWPHQKEAIKSWVSNGYHGILAMATGTGKTFTALSMTTLSQNMKIILVGVPTKPLLLQWVEEISNFDPDSTIISCSGEHNWRDVLPWKLANYRKRNTLRTLEKFYVITTLSTGSTTPFLKQFEGINSNKIVLICDEVHHIGATTFQNFLKINAKYRVGLSATPERQWDYEGTKTIMDYFNKTVYEYGIKEAIKDGYLSHYKYYPYFAYLNKEEFEEYIKYTNDINRIIASLQNKNKDNNLETLKIPYKTNKLERLLQERAKIRKKAKDKKRIFKTILKDIKKYPIIVFCEDNEQLNSVQQTLKGKNYLKYTSNLTNSQQKEVLNIFKGGGTEILLAIRCLDEGIDVPFCQGSIILASSSSTREYVQRRGRILRGKGDKVATLYDILTLPTTLHGHSELSVAEKLISAEMERMKILVEASDNEWESRNLIRKELSKIGLETLSLI